MKRKLLPTKLYFLNQLEKTHFFGVYVIVGVRGKIDGSCHVSNAMQPPFSPLSPQGCVVYQSPAAGVHYTYLKLSLIFSDLDIISMFLGHRKQIGL